MKHRYFIIPFVVLALVSTAVFAQTGVDAWAAERRSEMARCLSETLAKMEGYPHTHIELVKRQHEEREALLNKHAVERKNMMQQIRNTMKQR